MIAKLWDSIKASCGFTDEQMIKLYGERGVPPSQEEIDEVNEMLDSAGEGIPPTYIKLIDQKQKKVKVILGHAVEKWMYNHAKPGAHVCGHGSEWTIPEETYTLLLLKFGGENANI